MAGVAVFVVSSIVTKLGELLINEGRFSQGVGSQIEELKSQLDLTQNILIDAAATQTWDERVRGWVRKIKDVVNETEDAIDTYLERKDESHFGLRARHQLGNNISQIQSKIRFINEGFRNGILRYDGGVRLPLRRTAFLGHDNEIVGFEDVQKKLIEDLICQDYPERLVVSIVGQGGLGKTQIAEKIYMSHVMRCHFEFIIWLTVSNDFKLVDILRNILERFRKVVSYGESMEFLVWEIRNALIEKRYLVVLDDVWKDDLLIELFGALPDGSRGSRVLVTSRYVDIARKADPNSISHSLRFPTEEEGLELLYSTALPFRNQSEYSSTRDDLRNVAKQLVEKCGNLPLAIKVVGRLLSMKKATINDWTHVLETMSWRHDGTDCMNILALSYEDLPIHLRLCFLYLACFTKDHEIDARPLLSMWIAEGFIQPSSRSMLLEDLAESYLEDLARRSMVIVVQRNYDQSIKAIRVPSMLHHLVIEKAEEIDIVTISSNMDFNMNYSASVAYRVALQFSSAEENNLQLSELAPPKLRSLHCFGGQLLDCSGYKMLKVLNVERSMGFDHQMKWDKLTRLRLLRAVRNYGFPLSTNSLIQQADKLRNLQTLDLRASDVFEEFPENVWSIETLRHVLLPPGNIIPGPPSWAKLLYLQTLKYVQDSISWQPTQLPHMPDVRYLKLRVCVSSSLKTIVSLLQTLKKLISLRLDLSLNNYEVIEVKDFPFFENLKSLCLSGLWPQNLPLITSMFPLNLLKLQLNYSFLEQDPMPELEKLPTLRKLSFHAAYTGQKMICSSGGFPSLELLTLSSFSNLEELVIEDGAMPTLQLLKIVGCLKLRLRPKHPTCRIE